MYKCYFLKHIYFFVHDNIFLFLLLYILLLVKGYSDYNIFLFQFLNRIEFSVLLQSFK